MYILQFLFFSPVFAAPCGALCHSPLCSCSCLHPCCFALPPVGRCPLAHSLEPGEIRPIHIWNDWRGAWNVKMAQPPSCCSPTDPRPPPEQLPPSPLKPLGAAAVRLVALAYLSAVWCHLSILHLSCKSLMIEFHISRTPSVKPLSLV